MDVGIMLVRHLDDVCWKQLADPESPFEVSVPWMHHQVMANHFIASRKGSPFIWQWHKLFVHLWEGRTNCKGLENSELLAPVTKSIDFEVAAKRGFKWELSVDPGTIVAYLAQVMAWIRVAMLREPGPDGFDGVEYYATKILLFDGLHEDWGAETVVGFKGEDLFKTLVMKLDGDTESEEWKTAYRGIWRVLTDSSMQKVTHGKGLTKTVALGTLLDDEGHGGADVEKGTFAELLRFGSVRFEQTRESIRYVEAERTPEELVLRKGLLEP